MALHKVSELEGALLDAAVEKANGREIAGWTHVIYDEDGRLWRIGDGSRSDAELRPQVMINGALFVVERYSSEWEFGGPLIDLNKIELLRDGNEWDAFITSRALASEGARPDGSGVTPLVAVARAYVAAKFGDEVDL